MARTRDEKNKLLLVREPVWMRQAGESEKNHTAFQVYLNADGNKSMQGVCKDNGISTEVPKTDQWRHRAEQFWADVDQQTNDAIGRRLMRLRELSIDGAIDLVQWHEVEEVTSRTRMSNKTKKPVYAEKQISKKKLPPNSFVVNKVLDDILKVNDNFAEDPEALSAAFEEMVQATFGTDGPSPDEGVDDESSTV